MEFAALAGMARSMINEANVPSAIRYKLFGKVSETAIKFDSLVRVDIDGVEIT